MVTYAPPPAPPALGWPDPPPPPPLLPPPPPPPTSPPTAQRSPWFWLAITSAVVLLCTSGGASIAAFAHHAAAPSPGDPSAPSSPATDSAWAHTVSVDAVGLEGDFLTLASDSEAEDEAAASADCQTVLSKLASFQSDITPIPSDFATAGATLTQALQTFTDACTSLMSGIADQSASEITTAGTDISTGTALLDQVITDLHGVGSRALVPSEASFLIS